MVVLGRRGRIENLRRDVIKNVAATRTRFESVRTSLEHEGNRCGAPSGRILAEVCRGIPCNLPFGVRRLDAAF